MLHFPKCWKAKHLAPKIKEYRTSYTGGEASTGRSSIPFFCISLVTMITVVRKGTVKSPSWCRYWSKYLSSLSAEPLQCSPWEAQS